jgi:hypothetical protein
MSTTVILNRGFSLPPARPGRRGPPALPVSERAYRKALRAAELAAWNAADRTSPVLPPRQPETGSRSESIVFLVVAAAVVVALGLAGGIAMDWTESSDGLRSLVGSLLR